MSDEHDLSDYLLGELDAEAHAHFEQRLLTDSGLRARADRLRPLVGRLEELPQAAWQLRPEAEPLREPHRAPRSWRWPAALTLRPLAAAVAASLLLAVGLAGGMLVERGRSEDAGRVAQRGPSVTLRAIDGAPAASTALARMTAADHMVLTVRNLPPAKPGAYYEAWLMSDGKHLVPLASFMVDAGGRARIDVPLPASASDYRYIDVSLQRTAAGTAHSGHSVLRGSLT